MRGSGEGSQEKKRINPSIWDLWNWKHEKMNSFVSHNDSLPGEIIILKLVWPQNQSLFNCIYFGLLILLASLGNSGRAFSLPCVCVCVSVCVWEREREREKFQKLAYFMVFNRMIFVWVFPSPLVLCWWSSLLITHFPVVSCFLKALFTIFKSIRLFAF